MKIVRLIIQYAVFLGGVGVYVVLYYMFLRDIIDANGAAPNLDNSAVQIASGIGGLLGAAFAVAFGIQRDNPNVNEKRLNLGSTLTPNAEVVSIVCVVAYFVVGAAATVVSLANSVETPQEIKTPVTVFLGYVVGMFTAIVTGPGKRGNGCGRTTVFPCRLSTILDRSVESPSAPRGPAHPQLPDITVNRTFTPTNTLDRMTIAVDARVRPLVDLTERPRVRRVLRIAGYLLVAGILAFFVFGVVMVATMLRWGYVAAGVLLLAGVPLLLDGLVRRWRAVHLVVITPGTIVVPVVTLLGVDVLWASARIPRASPAFGLRGGRRRGGRSRVCLPALVGKKPPPHPRVWALYGVVAALALAALTGQEMPELRLILTALAAGLAAWLYLQRAAGPAIKHPFVVGTTAGTCVAVVVAPLLAEAIQGHRLDRVLLVAGR